LFSVKNENIVTAYELFFTIINYHLAVLRYKIFIDHEKIISKFKVLAIAREPVDHLQGK
jgi:hypothetical protein